MSIGFCASRVICLSILSLIKIFSTGAIQLQQTTANILSFRRWASPAKSD